MDEIQRRAFMKGAAIGALAFSVGGAEVMLTPRQAHAQNIPLRTLTPEQAATLGAMGEALVPGAKDAGVVNFVDQQLSIPAEQHDFIDLMRQNKLDGWKGPGSPFVYFLLRTDAVDVVYGTMDGYAHLGVPYQAHIAPTQSW